MNKEIQKFEQKHMMAFIELRDLEKQSKEIEARKKEVRDVLAKGMEEHGIKSIDNEYVKLTYIEPTTSTTLDTKKLRAEKPSAYNSLLVNYAKVTNKAGYVRITAK